jgi:hypothetical protein
MGLSGASFVLKKMQCLCAFFVRRFNYQPIAYNLDGKEDLLYWRKLLLALSGYVFKSYSNNTHNRKIVSTFSSTGIMPTL